ncbi:PREDICTED: fatty acid desaturase 6-like [Priapulus caudatus]|uniref:Fatty acid desaturase 6-like n=1 Tax=Priapulus caudatus TaxID=37621 RepID=A0ABM1EMC7_PRICU|nr:PREDICTED: fatty acid desaturase 6-like [Priapulus caudatus]
MTVTERRVVANDAASTDAGAAPSDDVDKPEYGALKRQVNAIVANTSWWQLYGVDWSHIIISALLLWPLGLVLFSRGGMANYVVGLLLQGVAYAIVANKGGHIASHGALCRSRTWARFWCWLFVECHGSYSAAIATEVHIRVHHPHTNVIGLGDSSSWKAPHLPRYIYMFVAPVSLPVITPFVAIRELWGRWNRLARFLVGMLSGLGVLLSLLCYVGGFSLPAAIVTLYVGRALLAVPYIHINIFQHIGLPMYSDETRPPRLQLMSTGCLNLSRHPILDYCFGHSLVSCHVEHHLFPELSDNMCLRVKPVVRKYLLDHKQTYNESTYTNRLQLFVKKYKELMVDPPSVSEFVGFGLQ